jgi:hypothetical protein
MTPTIRNRSRRKAKPLRQEILKAKRASPAAEPGRSPEAIPESAGLPGRKALVARLEAQRLELIRAMACVNGARRTIEQHVAKPPFGGERPVSPEQHELYRQQVLAALSDAGDALHTAYPMLERVAQALVVEEILKEHAPPNEAPAADTAPLTQGRVRVKTSGRLAR